jgi:hypothetical protein
MPAERPVIREISWRDVFPWLIVFRTFGLATSLPVLFLATLGTVLTPVGWWLGELCFVSPATVDVNPAFAQVVEANRSGPHRPFPPFAPGDGRVPTSLQTSSRLSRISSSRCSGNLSIRWLVCLMPV